VAKKVKFFERPNSCMLQNTEMIWG